MKKRRGRPNERRSKCRKRIVVVDLFCGIGGLTYGLRKVKRLNVVAGIDLDSTCAYAYEENNPGVQFLQRDVSQFDSRELEKLYPKGCIKVLVGCAPCQPFSPYSNPNKDGARKGDKWNLLLRFGKYIDELTPHVVSMENVPEIEGTDVFDTFVALLKQKGYKVWSRPVECVEYGIPQTRTRMVLFASRLGKIEILPPTHRPDNYVTVNDAIGDLPPIAAGETHPDLPLHRASALAPINLERVRASVPGGSWRDWPDRLKLDCHKKDSGKSFGSVYGRMRPDEPAPTMTTQFNGLGNGRFGHPVQDRGTSILEGMDFQTFPRDYKMIDPEVGFSFTNLARHIGNAVPVRLGEIIGRTIKNHLEQHHA